MKYRISPTYSEAVYWLKMRAIECLLNTDEPGATSQAWRCIEALERGRNTRYLVRYEYQRPAVLIPRRPQ